MFDRITVPAWIARAWAGYQAWRWRKRVGPILTEIAAVDSEIEIALRHHKRVSSLHRRKKELKNRQIRMEMSLL